jgi:hypothetical protein
MRFQLSAVGDAMPFGNTTPARHFVNVAAVVAVARALGGN